MTTRWYLKEGPLGEFQGIAALEIDGVRYSCEEVERIVTSYHAAHTAKVCGNSVQPPSRRCCAVVGCGEKQDGLSPYCKKHGMRFRRHGDPLMTKQPWSRKRAAVEEEDNA